MTRADPARTHAVVVGIETYGVRGWRDLDGPALDACRFTDWLLERGVPPGNVRLFLSPLSKNAGVGPTARADGGHARVPVSAATEDAVYRCTRDLQRLRDVDLLLVFWGGHGLSDVRRNRYLLYADATRDNPANLKLNAWLDALQTSTYQGIARQVVIVDACANDKGELGLASQSMPETNFALGAARAPCQFVLYASQRGQAAMNLDREQTGALSREVLRALADEVALPPDMDAVGRRVRAAFATMRERGELRQVPVDFSVTDWNGEERREVAVADPDDYCEIAAIMYDRERPEAEFWSRPGEILCADATAPAQAYLVHGESREQHRSFLKRVLATEVRKCAESWLGSAEGSFVRVEPEVEWPGARGVDLAAMQRQLHVALVNALGARDAPRAVPGAGWKVLLGHRYASLPLVVIPHVMTLASWGYREGGRQQELLRWYLGEYWGRPPAPAPESGLPRVMLFLLVECDERMAQQGPFARHLRIPCDKDRAVRDVTETFLDAASAPHPVSRVMLSELTPLEPVHIERWLMRWVRPLEGGPDYEYSREAEALYKAATKRRDDIRRTDYIEMRLDQRYREAASAAGKGT